METIKAPSDLQQLLAKMGVDFCDFEKKPAYLQQVLPTELQDRPFEELKKLGLFQTDVGPNMPGKDLWILHDAIGGYYIEYLLDTRTLLLRPVPS